MKCVRCLEYKELSEFGSYSRSAKGVNNTCKSCRREINKKYFSTDKGKACRSRHYEKGKARASKWCRENRERNREACRKYNNTKKGKETRNAWNNKRYWLDPEYGRLKALSRIHGCEVGVLAVVKERDKSCRLCGSKEELTFDHIFPVSLGGRTTEQNLQRLCNDCNSFKYNHLFLPDGGMMLIGKEYVRVS